MSLRSLFCTLSTVVLLGAAALHAQTTDQIDQNNQQVPSSATIPSPANTTTTNPNLQTPGTNYSQYPETDLERQARLARGAQQTAQQQLFASENQTPLPPEPPSPFQQMVRATTGERLEIYGSSLFRRVPTTFAPVENVPVGPDYVLGPGDEIELQLSGQVNRALTLTVDRDGSVLIPEVGSVHVAGLTYGALNGFLSKQLGRIYRNFTVSTSLGALRTIQVFVVGQARRPGSFSISSLSTLLNALFISGGPSPTGSVRNIEVKRNGQTIDHFDLYDLLLHGDKSHDIPLATGDVIFIPFAGPQVAVVGSVNHPAIYELKGQTSVEQALDFAGGENSQASGANVLLERVYEHENRNVESVSLDQSKTEMLQGGDILSVRSVVDRFRNAVTLRGNVANPGRYAWHPGMRVSDLIPNRESLITRDYWRKRNQLGQFIPEQGEEPAQNLRPPTQYYPGLRQGQTQQQNPGAQTQGSQQGYANQPYSNQNGPQSYNGAQDQSSPYNAPPMQNGSGDQYSQENDGRGLSQQSQQNQQNQNGYQSQGGNGSVAAALAGGSGRFPPKNDVVLSAPDIDWSYAVIERQDAKTLTTSLIPFNLGKIVLDSDASQDVELLPGDVVTVFSKADIRVPSVQQTRYVRLEGEFNAPGVYSVQPGETLRSLVQRAGGFTPEAYLYASEFTRESTRRVEQQRLSEYADQLEAQITAVTASNQARALSTGDATAAVASETAARADVARLRRIRPIGRIVLDLKPNSEGIDSVPDVALEDGDRFIVPRVPSSVNVEGQVYSANAFLYHDAEQVRDYLHKAGGPDRQADRKRMFVLRADGSVISEQYANVMKSAVYPGDTIVVPPILDRRSILQRTVDIAQIAGNFALSAAALAVLVKQ